MAPFGGVFVFIKWLFIAMDARMNVFYSCMHGNDYQEVIAYH